MKTVRQLRMEDIVQVNDDLPLATNVKLGKDLTFKGNYQVGVIDVASYGEDGLTFKKDMTIYDMLFQIFNGDYEDAQPVIQPPSMTFTATPQSSPVIGTAVDIKYSIVFNPGKYTTTLNGVTKQQATNVTPSSYEVKLGTQTLTTASGTFTGYVIPDVQTLNLTAKVFHTQGDIAKTFYGKDTEMRIEAGNVSKSASIAPVKPVVVADTYYYIGDDLDSPITSAFLTSTAEGHSSDSGTVLDKTLVMPKKSSRIVYAVPGNHTFVKLESVRAIIQDITNNPEQFEQPYRNELMSIDGQQYRVVQYRKPADGPKIPPMSLKFTFS